jgi:DegV family protein with EDD domain
MDDKKIVIVTDSSAYIPAEAMQGLDIAVIPLWLIWDEERFQDGVDITPGSFYKRLKESKTLPTSSQPSAKEFEIFFRDLAKTYDEIICVLVSSKISGTVACAQAAQAEITDFAVHIVDALNSSMGLGFSVLAAARAATEGRTVPEISAAAKEMRDMVHLMFVVDTLEYLHRGGRIGGAKRWFGSALRIKPLLQFAEGVIGPLAQARTKRKAVDLLFNLVEERLAGKPMAEAAVVHIDCLGEAEDCVARVTEQFNPERIFLGDVSPVVGTHVGPGALGIAFYPRT